MSVRLSEIHMDKWLTFRGPSGWPWTMLIFHSNIQWHTSVPKVQPANMHGNSSTSVLIVFQWNTRDASLIKLIKMCLIWSSLITVPCIGHVQTVSITFNKQWRFTCQLFTLHFPLFWGKCNIDSPMWASVHSLALVTGLLLLTAIQHIMIQPSFNTKQTITTLKWEQGNLIVVQT